MQINDPLYSVGRNGFINAFFQPKGYEFQSADKTADHLASLAILVALATLAVMYFRK